MVEARFQIVKKEKNWKSPSECGTITFTMNGEISNKQLRKMTGELSLLSRSDGSASLCSGDTSMIASVYGPAEVKIAKEQISRATVEVTYRPKSGMPGCNEKLKENIICNTCESVILTCLHPRSSVSLTIQELHHAGSQLACALNVANLALLDANVNMKFMVAAVNCAFTDKGQLILDPTLKEEQAAQVTMTFAFDSVSKDILTVYTTGLYTEEEFDTALKACKAASVEIFNFYQEIMQKNLSKE